MRSSQVPGMLLRARNRLVAGRHTVAAGTRMRRLLESISIA